MDSGRITPVAPTAEQRNEARTSHIARTGETEFAAIVRNRSGQDAGEIDFGLKHGDIINDLCDGDKQSLVDTAYALAKACEGATGKSRRRESDEAVGQRIIDAIVSGGLIRSECPDSPDSGVLTVWAANAAEQIGRLAIEASK